MAARRKQGFQGSAENGRSRTSSQWQPKNKTSKKREKDSFSNESASNRISNRYGIGYALLVALLACICGILHRNHVATLFENDRHFSHLSALERELAFRTEMGLYYSYYKTIIEAPTFLNGFHAIMNDNVTEFPQTINTLKRFNLYPEVFLGLGYRVFESVMGKLDIQTRMCWKVNRGEGMPSVESCEGLGEPSYFYIESVFLLNGINMAVIFLFATYISGSIVGGGLAVMSFFYNHGECTRVQWTPPLRESFAYPFFVIEMFFVTFLLKTSRPSYLHSFFIAVTATCFMLPWQFAQFALMTQTVAVFGTYVLQFIGSHKMKLFLIGQSVGLFISYIFLFGNEMLLTSFYASCLFTVIFIVMAEPLIEKLKVRVLIWGVQGILLAVGTLGLKIASGKLLKVTDDAHIGDIFRSKFTEFRNFHTMLYTCAPEFDFMEAETPWRLLKTLLAPCSLIVVVASIIKILINEHSAWQNRKHHVVVNGNSQNVEQDGESSCRKHRSKPHAELVYQLFQLVAFTAMAIIIMRLKLFWTPHLCLITALLASREIFGWVGDQYRHYALLGATIGLMSVQGVANLQHQWGILGEFSNYPMEELVDWINYHTPPNAVFAGPMPTMATIKLCTSRPIVNHPHYEDAGLRARTKKVYTIYSRKLPSEVWQHYVDLKVDYAILEDSWCVRRSRPGCGMAEIWDLEDEENRGKIPVCAKLHQTPLPYFKKVFKNDVFDVLEVVKKPSMR